MSIKANITAAAFVLALPIAATAATVTTGSNGKSFSLKPGETHTTTWEAGSTFDISDIGYTLNGAGLASIVKSNIEKVIAEGNGSTGTVWDYYTIPTGKVTFGFSYSDGFTIAAGSTFTVSMSYAATGTQNLQATYTFTASPVPVPAAGALLVSALAGLGVAKRRKKS